MIKKKEIVFANYQSAQSPTEILKCWGMQLEEELKYSTKLENGIPHTSAKARQVP